MQIDVDVDGPGKEGNKALLLQPRRPQRRTKLDGCSTPITLDWNPESLHVAHGRQLPFAPRLLNLADHGCRDGTEPVD